MAQRPTPTPTPGPSPRPGGYPATKPRPSPAPKPTLLPTPTPKPPPKAAPKPVAGPGGVPYTTVIPYKPGQAPGQAPGTPPKRPGSPTRAPGQPLAAGSKPPGGHGPFGTVLTADTPLPVVYDEKSYPPYENKRLHPKSETNFDGGFNFPEGGRLHRGMIVRRAQSAGQERSAMKTPWAKTYKFNFLYNPETVSISTSAYAGLKPPEQHNPENLLRARFAGQEQMSFALMLDRTQEAYEQGIKTFGTLPDINALYKVVNGPEGYIGFLYLSAVEIFFGPQRGNTAHPLPPFLCYITGIQLEHTKFSPRMTPIRTIVSITANRLTSTAAGQNAARLFGTGD